MSIHLPVRPGWECRGCGGPWPCPTRQRELMAEYQCARVSLMLYLSGYFVQACVDLPMVASGRLYCRFLGWAAGLPDQVRR